MPKTRINKFIFQDGNVFFRIKTTAKNLVFKKNEDNYLIEFSSVLSEGEKNNIPVQFIPNLTESPAQNSTSTTYTWGKLIKESSTENESHFFYYLVPEKYNFAAKLGPVTEQVLDSDLEIDWPNIQWGVMEE
ncbi:MAG: hypothetical protein HOI53_08615 [Francisellaceae bacterium]|jgi:hypothetical protein|nr:hypothetical protein [Francisellaceae bacterium]MBT6208077.1 hypothetical protein [Francisellaceae bacterium]MBT6538785.1 hypothetical protein [Francisellaceae bacterium]